MMRSAGRLSAQSVSWAQALVDAAAHTAPPAPAACGHPLRHGAAATVSPHGPCLLPLTRPFTSGGPLLHAAPGEESLRSAEKLLDLMTSSPALQQMMLASMPAHLRANPEMLKKILSDPGMKAKMAEMIAKQGVKFPPHVLDRLNASHMEDTMNRLRKVGINPMDIPQKLMSYPGIFKQLQDPKYMQAFLETAEDPAAAARHGDEVMEVVRKAQEVLRSSKQQPAQQAQQTADVQDATVLSYTASSQPTTTTGTAAQGSAAAAPAQPAPPPPGQPPQPSASPSTSSSADAAPSQAGTSSTDPQPGATGAVPFMPLLGRDPALAAKLQNPRVQKALEEISKSPWKTIKYVLDKDVMEVFTALNKLLKTGGAPPPQPPPGSK